jgi:hypothetical protein
MPYYTPPTEQAMNVLRAHFPGIDFGIYNRRKISGSSRWSQHSWPNALDLYGPDKSSSAEDQAFLDEVYQFLRAHWDSLNLKVALWRVRNHYNHIHIDFWPSGYGTPSLIRGGSDNRYRYPDGSIRAETVLINTFDLEEDIMQNGDEGLRVVAVQNQLMALGYELPEYGADGDYGDETVEAVKAFQTDTELDVDGVLRATDTAILFQALLVVDPDTKDPWARKEAKRANDRLDAAKEAI